MWGKGERKGTKDMSFLLLIYIFFLLLLLCVESCPVTNADSVMFVSV